MKKMKKFMKKRFVARERQKFIEAPRKSSALTGRILRLEPDAFSDEFIEDTWSRHFESISERKFDLRWEGFKRWVKIILDIILWVSAVVAAVASVLALFS